MGLKVFFLSISWFFFNSVAFAQASPDLISCSADIELPAEAQTRSFSQISTSILMEYAWPCSRGIFQGVWESTGGLVESTGKCILSPIECAKKARLAIKNAYSFFSNITEEVTKAFRAISGMPASDIAEIICSTIASIGTDVILGILTAGAIAGKLGFTVAKIALKLQKLASMAKKVVKLPLKFLARLSKKQMVRVERLVALGYESALYSSMGTCQ